MHQRLGSVLCLGVFAATAALLPSSAAAYVTVSSPAVNTFSGPANGFLDVYLDAPPADTAVAFVVELQFGATAGTSVRFGDNVQDVQGRTALLPPANLSTSMVSDNDTFGFSNDIGGSAVALFDEAGLARIPFTVDQGFVGTVPVTVTFNQFLRDNSPSGQTYSDAAPVSGAIVAAVPEPTGLIGLAAAGGLLALRRRRA